MHGEGHGTGHEEKLRRRDKQKQDGGWKGSTRSRDPSFPYKDKQRDTENAPRPETPSLCPQTGLRSERTQMHEFIPFPAMTKLDKENAPDVMPRLRPDPFFSSIPFHPLHRHRNPPLLQPLSKKDTPRGEGSRIERGFAGKAQNNEKGNRHFFGLGINRLSPKTRR